MNGKKGSVEIKIPPISKEKISDSNRIYVDGVDFSCKSFISSVWEFCKEDVDRVTFSLKVGLAVLIVSLLILCRDPYRVFGTNIIWSILTVAIMFEYTVGATFNRGFNRALGSLLAGVMAIAIAQIALSTGQVAEPIIIGFSIFIVGTVTSFMKLWPSLVPYEYGFRVMLFTYCLIIVSGYRMGSPFRTAMDRLYSIAIGGIVAVSVNLLIFPIWAGEQLHKELVNNFASVADALEECVRKYLQDDGSEQPEFTKTVMDDFPDEPAYRKCRSTLNSAAKFETLANSAKWEPPHGRFNHFFYPWSEYVKVGAVLRYCAYEVMAIHGVLHSEIQAPYNLRITFQKEIQEASSTAAELVRYLGQNIDNMQWSLKSCLLKRVHVSTERLQRAIDMHSYLLTSDNSSIPQTKLDHAMSSTLADLDPKLLEQNLDPPNQLPGSTVTLQVESYHETMRKQSRRQYSWPSREVDAFEDDRGFNKDSIPKMQALESTTNLSLATFTSLLIEFVARLNHLVEAVDELSNMAKFKHCNA
ncbi:aluminum-activated malate transporter 9-like [Dorcoceras hygrometricum]|uniref:Aluminum-activated malate transporter 9-like n=1 Tax=Dorcoceras hygrometricum TaxID=472368 RepID=A0A2Z7CD81_9LAMI|nr:aluminum-activated malate transporter 9-like [Dorcoceras hygrometricum]